MARICRELFYGYYSFSRRFYLGLFEEMVEQERDKPRNRKPRRLCHRQEHKWRFRQRPTRACIGLWARSHHLCMYTRFPIRLCANHICECRNCTPSQLFRRLCTDTVLALWGPGHIDLAAEHLRKARTDCFHCAGSIHKAYYYNLHQRELLCRHKRRAYYFWGAWHWMQLLLAYCCCWVDAASILSNNWTSITLERAVDLRPNYGRFGALDHLQECMDWNPQKSKGICRRKRFCDHFDLSVALGCELCARAAPRAGICTYQRSPPFFFSLKSFFCYETFKPLLYFGGYVTRFPDDLFLCHVAIILLFDLVDVLCRFTFCNNWP